MDSRRKVAVTAAGPSYLSTGSPSRCLPDITAYVPTYSTGTMKLLEEGQIHKGWNRFIEETSYHVLAVGEFDRKYQYEDFGRWMSTKYPCIDFKAGQHPWSYFTKVLSQKIRNIRWKRNKRSDNPTAADEPASKKRKTHIKMAVIDDSDDMDHKAAKEILVDELKKPSNEQDKPKILKGQRVTFRERRLFIENLKEDGSVQAIVEAHPILGMTSYVEKEFYLLKPNLSTKAVMLDRFTDLLTDFDKVVGRESTENDDECVDDDATLLDILRDVEDKIKFSSKKSKTSLPDLITVLDVTGSNKGIGFAVVRALCKSYDGDVLLTSRDEGRGHAAIADLNKEGLQPKFHQLDINDRSSIERLKDFLLSTYGGLDVLVNNAAIAYKDADPTPFSEKAGVTCKTNFWATLDVCRILFPLLRPHARVVNVSSMHSQTALTKCSPVIQSRFKDPSLTMDGLEKIMQEFVDAAKTGHHLDQGFCDMVYGTSKTGVSTMSFIQDREIRKDARQDIVINACTPGYVATDMTSHKGTKTIDEGADTLVYLALLPQNTNSPRGNFVRDRTIHNWE